MITYDIICGCLDILDLKYNILDDGRILVTFYDEKAFASQIATFIAISDDSMLTFTTYAPDYHPEGDLLQMANRHNSRAFSPSCFINDDGDIVMDRCFIIDAEVSPNYLLEDVVKASIYLPIDAFMLFEASDEEINERQNNR